MFVVRADPRRTASPRRTTINWPGEVLFARAIFNEGPDPQPIGAVPLHSFLSDHKNLSGIALAKLLSANRFINDGAEIIPW